MSGSDCPGSDVCCLDTTAGGGGGKGGKCEATCAGLTLCSGNGDCPAGETCETLGPIKGCVGGDAGKGFTAPDGGFHFGPDAG
jgi:hypothetical protein